MSAQPYEVALDGRMVERGFWLYVWEATTAGDDVLLYVGRTGDSSSVNAQSPFNRMGQHLGSAKNSSMLRNHLSKRDIVPERCTYRLIAYGPILDEAKNWDDHRKRRDVLAGLEKHLAEELLSAGYEVMNIVNSKASLDATLYREVQDAFAASFPKLAANSRPLES